MAEAPDILISVAGAGDVASIASLRSLWSEEAEGDAGFKARMADWVAGEGDRRTTWLASLGGAAVGMASLFEYRRMPRPGCPDSRWGYLSNMFVRPELRNRGIGSRLLRTIIVTADERGYVRLVLSPSPRALQFYRRAGFVIPDEAVPDDRLLIRAGRQA